MKFAADENFDNRILRGLKRRIFDLDVVRVQDLAIAGAEDPIVLAWAAENGRILLTHDQRTIPGFAFDRISRGETMAGVIVVPVTIAPGQVIDDILLIIDASSQADWVNQVQRLPL
ncbi:MAG: DUF5615 family PIN-like protein [Anaerolineales bacterium]|nr:DUF5615 family PIN-like protein [Anaerolineales bacterium]